MVGAGMIAVLEGQPGRSGPFAFEQHIPEPGLVGKCHDTVPMSLHDPNRRADPAKEPGIIDAVPGEYLPQLAVGSRSCYLAYLGLQEEGDLVEGAGIDR